MADLTEPVPGATPLDEGDLAGLIPTWVTTRADLDAVENEGIQRAVLWVFSPRVRYEVDDVLTAAFADRLHARMFGKVWRWAGKRRQRVTNIGVEPYQITTKLRDVFGLRLPHWEDALDRTIAAVFARPAVAAGGG